MTETLLTPSSIVLFGRAVEDIAIVRTSKTTGGESDGDESNLNEQLSYSAGTKSKPITAQFARIYGFSYGGTYFQMTIPCMFLVHGDGADLKEVPAPGPNSDDETFYKSLKAWTYNHADETMRLDISSGRFEQVLLSLIDPKGGRTSGAMVSGAMVSGAMVSGAMVSGAMVSGAMVSGARTSGARNSQD